MFSAVESGVLHQAPLSFIRGYYLLVLSFAKLKFSTCNYIINMLL